MQGIQRFTKHEKASANGLSYSVIFRRLTPYSGRLANTHDFNKQVQIDWINSVIPRAWRLRPDISNQLVGTTYELREFNKRRLHPVQMCSVSSRHGFAVSIVLYSKQNIVSKCGNKIWFIGYQTTDKKSMALNNCLLATRKVSLIAVYKKLKDGKRMFLGNFYVDKVVQLQKRMYFALLKYE